MTLVLLFVLSVSLWTALVWINPEVLTDEQLCGATGESNHWSTLVHASCQITQFLLEECPLVMLLCVAEEYTVSSWSVTDGH